MATLRKAIEDFIYPFLERVTDMVYKGGEDTVWHGVRVLDDDIKFTHGAMVSAVGFDASEDVESVGERDFRGIHGWIVDVKRHSVTNPKILGYDMKI